MVAKQIFYVCRNVNTLCSQYTSQILGIINFLKCIIAPDTLPLIFFKPLNAIIIPDG